MAEKQWTDKQRAFVEALFEHPDEDMAFAKEVAGYDEKTPTAQIFTACRELIIEYSNSYMASNLPKAVDAVKKALENPKAYSNAAALAAANIVFDRGGLTRKVDASDGPVQLRAILILPPKDSENQMFDVTPALERMAKPAPKVIDHEPG